eukprot:5273301-Prorocentrum_lima.AAC.1
MTENNNLHNQQQQATTTEMNLKTMNHFKKNMNANNNRQYIKAAAHKPTHTRHHDRRRQSPQRER